MLYLNGGIIFSQWLHNKKFSALSEGIFDILISDQIREAEIKNVFEIWKFLFSAIQNSSVTFLQNPSDIPYNLS